MCVDGVYSLELGKLLLELARGRGLERLLVVLVEVARVALLALGHEGRLDLLLVDGYPVGEREPLVVLDVVDAVLQIAVAFGQVDLEQIAQQVLEVRAEVRGKAHLARHDLLVDLYGLIGEEGRIAGGHLVDEHAECPPVDGLVVALAENDLGRQVLGRAAQCPRAALDALGEAEVGHLQVAVLVDKQVLGLQIAIQDLQVVQVLEREHDLRAVEARVRLGKAAHAPQMREHLATRNKLQHHEQVQIVLQQKQHFFKC